MAITFSCTCGKQYRVDDALAGKRTRCPACKATLVVPAPETKPEEEFADFEVVEEADEPGPVYGFVQEDSPKAIPATARAKEPDSTPEPAGADSSKEPEEAGGPAYFVVAHQGEFTLSPKFFRVYPDGDGLLLIHAGPFNWNMVGQLQGEAIRGMAARTAGAHGAEVGLGLGLLASAANALASMADAKALKKRAEVLDPMDIEELRNEIEADKHSFRVTAEDTSDVRIEPSSTKLWANKNVERQIIGRVKFIHKPTGKWSLLLLTKADARAAIRAFRKVFGKEQVDVTLRLKKEPG
jgi:hypothetical protein